MRSSCSSRRRAILTIAKRQPMARDLREIMVAIRIASDLERIGDLAKNIAKRTHAISEQLPRKLAAGLTRMGRLSLEQLKDVLDAYTTADDAKALEVWRNDGELDALYNSIFRELLTYMMEDPRMIGPVHPSALRRQELRAHRRSCHQYRREHPLSRVTASRCARSVRSRTPPAPPPLIH